MSTYTQILYQIIFSTKNREPVLTKQGRPELFKHIWGILQNKKCHLYRVNGVEDHLHLVIHLHPTIALASLVKDIKVSTSLMIKAKNLFDSFENWQVGYSAFTYSIDAKNNLIEYVKNQEEHHKKKTFKEELIGFYEKHKVDFDEKYLL